MLQKEIITGSVGTALSATGTALQPNDILQTISLVLTIIGTIITFIILPLLAWWKKAKADGKITADEAKEAVDIVIDGSQHVKEDLDKKGK